MTCFMLVCILRQTHVIQIKHNSSFCSLHHMQSAYLLEESSHLNSCLPRVCKNVTQSMVQYFYSQVQLCIACRYLSELGKMEGVSAPCRVTCQLFWRNNHSSRPMCAELKWLQYQFYFHLMLRRHGQLQPE